MRLADLSAVSGAAGDFQATLRDAFVAAGIDVAPLDDTNEALGSLRAKNVDGALAGDVGSRVADEQTLRAIRTAGKQLGVAAVFLGGAESYSFDETTGSVHAKMSVGLINTSTGEIAYVRTLSASAEGGDGPGARRGAFDAVSQRFAKQIVSFTTVYMESIQ